jgi:hypothetical protein
MLRRILLRLLAISIPSILAAQTPNHTPRPV